MPTCRELLGLPEPVPPKYTNDQIVSELVRRGYDDDEAWLAVRTGRDTDAIEALDDRAAAEAAEIAADEAYERMGRSCPSPRRFSFEALRTLRNPQLPTGAAMTPGFRPSPASRDGIVESVRLLIVLGVAICGVTAVQVCMTPVAAPVHVARGR